MRPVTIVFSLFVALVLTCTVAYATSGDQPNPGVVAQRDPSVPEKTHSRIQLSDGEWQMRSYRNTSGRTCVQQQIPREGTGTTCASAQDFFREGDIYAIFGARELDDELGWDNLFAYGFVSPRVQRLVLVNLSCAASDVPFDESGAFMVAVDKGAINLGLSPYKLLALDKSGETIDVRHVRPAQSKAERAAKIDEVVPGVQCR